MGLFDTVIVLDDIPELSCARGHALRSFQTKELDEPSMSTYLVRHGRLYRTGMANAWSRDEDESTSWRFEEEVAVHERRYTLSEVPVPLVIHIYCNCRACDPVLVRTAKPGLYGDLVSEHLLFADFRISFRRDEPILIERTSGTRDDVKKELGNRGMYVLQDDEPLAVAHREIQHARRRAHDEAPPRACRF